MLPKIELRIREQEALLKILEEKMANPANHLNQAMSQSLAEEHMDLKQIVDELMQKWEELMEAAETD